MIWFFNKESDADKQARQRQQATVAALDAGGLPPIAVERLERERALGGSFFASDLSCREYLLLQEMKVQTLGQVMGTAFYKVRYGGLGMRGYQTTTEELHDLTLVQMEARHKAVSRLQQEAALLGAHGVVGVRLLGKNHSWSGALTEFTAIGTAVRVPGMQDGRTPFTSALNGQEFWQLCNAGYEPRGLVMGASCYYIYTDPTTRSRMRNWWGGNNTKNQELEIYTKGITTAQHKAMGRLENEVEHLGADGAVGMTIDMDVEEIEYEVNDTRYIDLLCNFVLIGTAVRLAPGAESKAKTRTLLCLDLATRSYRSLESTGSYDGSGFAFQGESLADDDDNFDDDE